MNVDSARRYSIELRPMLPDQAGQVGTDVEDPYARVGEAKGLSRYIPAQKLRSMTMPRTLAASLRLLAPLPQYASTARPINRLLGGPVQPLSSAMGSSYVTDMVWHQLLPCVGRAIAEGPATALRAMFNPFFSVAFACGWGIPVGLHKLGHFQQSHNIQKLALQLAGGDALLAREVGKLLKAAMQPRAAASEVGQAMQTFIAQHQDVMHADLVTFAQAVEAGDASATANATALLKCARAYAETDEAWEFADGVRQLNRVVPISAAPWGVGDETSLLLQDGAKVGVLVGLMAIQWTAWGIRMAHDDSTARDVAVTGAFALASVTVHLALVAVAGHFMQRMLRRAPDAIAAGRCDENEGLGVQRGSR